MPDNPESPESHESAAPEGPENVEPAEETDAPDVPAADSRRRGILVWSAVGVVAVAIIVVLIVAGVNSGKVDAKASPVVPTAVPSDTPVTAVPTETAPVVTPTADAGDASGDRATAAPVPLASPATVTDGVQVNIVNLESVAGEAQGGGEVAGPALRFQVDVVNSSASPINLSTVGVTLDYGSDNSPASSLSGPGVVSFPATAAPGATASAIYVFAVPADGRDSVRILVDYQVAVPVVAFVGPAPAAG